VVYRPAPTTIAGPSASATATTTAARSTW
jgi:hypothetical protein